MSNTRVVVTVDGVDHALDIGNLTGRESGVLKRVGKIKGVLEVADALRAGDMEVVVALAVIAMQRSGINADPERLLDMPHTMFRITIPENPT